MTDAPVLLRGVDRAAMAVGFVDRLRRAGVSVGVHETETFTRAIEACPPDRLSRLYWTSRVTLVRTHHDLATFDKVFDVVFRDASLPVARTSRDSPTSTGDDTLAAVPGPDDPDAPDPADNTTELPWMTLPAPVAAADDGTNDSDAIPELRPSEIAALADTPFDGLDPAQLAAVGGWLERALADWPTRRSRRRRHHHRGHRVSLRRTVDASRRTGWEPVRLVHERPRRRRRPMVMIADVSQSMQPYTLCYLHLMRAAVQGADAEVFAFATDLTRLTPALRHRSPEAAIDHATDAVVDRFGGTRIATNVRAVLASHHGTAVRGAVVVIASDGWDTDPPDDLARVMARLGRLAHKVIWLNPRTAAAGYEPAVAGMAAAWPHCDAVLPADRLAVLPAVLDAITAPTR